MTVQVRNQLVRKIDTDNHVICFNPSKHGKITGSRFLAVLGKDNYTSDFKAACLIARIYSEFEPTKYTEAGDKIEPIIRSYVRDNWDVLLKDRMSLSEGDVITVEEPVDKRDCHYDHFGSEPIFGGLVDGYLRLNGTRKAILEIKTSSHRDDWADGKVPEGYLLQASLYAELAGLDTIVFAVGFLEDGDYDEPEAWAPTDDNTKIVVMHKKDISEEMEYAEDWFKRFILRGMTPKWTDRDECVIDNFIQREVTFLSGELVCTINKLIDSYGKCDTSEMEDEIKHALAGKMLTDNDRIKYEHNGYVFQVKKVDGQCVLTITRS